MAQIAIVDRLANVAIKCIGCPEPTMIRAYANAARELCLRSRWLKREIPGATTADEPSYDLGDDPYTHIIGIHSIQITLADGKKRLLTERSSSTWDANAGTDEPEFYQYLPTAQVALHPTPDAAYDLLVSVFVAPKDGVNSLEDSLVNRWNSVLERGALGFLRDIGGQPWTDKRQAELDMAAFHRKCNSIAHNAERGYNPGAAVTDEPGQHQGVVLTTNAPF